MAENYYSTNTVKTEDMGQVIDDMVRIASDRRKGFERRWYDNNFFDDGYHFRYLSRTEGKIVDLSERQSIYAPMRAIPKASRQIRGVANLMLSQDPTPIVYPESVSKSQYPDVQGMDPSTGQPINQPNPEYQEAMKEAKRIAKSIGHWIEEEFKEQGMLEKLALMAILSAKHGVSYLQIWPDPVREKILTQVYDAFDIYLDGSLTEIYDSPYIIKAIPMFISQIKANEDFDPEQLKKINPDNKQASSDIKEAYMRAKYYQMGEIERAAKLILKEALLKEYLNSENMEKIGRQKNGSEILKGKKQGDQIIRQIFVAGNVWLKDTYLNLPDYPFVDFRYEPGPIYQVPLIERFIPQNKSLDVVASRVERYTNTMVSGVWLKRQGEQFNITNQAGGQVIEYSGITPPVQGQIAPIPAFVFNYINLLQSFIEEQGVSTSTLGKVPTGVKANAAIESLKESEFANLVIPSRRLKGTVKKVSEKFMDLADSYFIEPKTVYYLEKGEPQYFNVIGDSAIEKRDSVGVETPDDVIRIKKDYKVDIEIQSGLGYTREAKKQAALQLGEYILKMVEMGAMPPEAMQKFVEQLLEVYQFGATSEIMETFQNFEPGGLTSDQLEKMKLAIAEVLNDLKGSEVLPDEQQRVEEGKLATAEALKDTGLIDNKPQDPLIQKEIEQKEQEMRHAEEEHELKMQKMRQELEIDEQKADVDVKIKAAQAKQGMTLKEQQVKAQTAAMKKGVVNNARSK